MSEDKHRTIQKMWDANANAWSELSREGYDTYRDHINTPAFLSILPPIEKLKGLDLGCGDGHNTRLLAEKGAHMSAIDISSVFIQKAQEAEEEKKLGIDYRVANATQLPFSEANFDFVTAFMSLMDMAEIEKVFQEVKRVLKPGGLFQFSICHPCFNTPRRKQILDDEKNIVGVVCGDYFQRREAKVEWIFSALEEERKKHYSPFSYYFFYRTLGDWINGLIESGFSLTKIAEPSPSEECVEAFPNLKDASLFAYFLIVQSRRMC